MTHAAMAASWATRGPLARAAHFRISEDDGRLDIIVDAGGLGSRGSGVGRAWRSLPMGADDATIEAALTGLYEDLGGVSIAGPQLEGRAFREVAPE